MSGGNAYSRETDLTGVWSGEYWYVGASQPTPFTAHIIETAGSLTGTTLEPATFGAPGLTELSADINGSHGDRMVDFTKIYHPAPGVHRAPILYAGLVDDQLTTIEGEWTFGPGRLIGAGRFILVRVSRGATAEVLEREVELEVRK